MIERETIKRGGRRVAAAMTEFFTAPASAKPLAVFRIGLAAVLLAQAFSLAANVTDLFGREGLIQWDVTYDGTDRSAMAWAYPHLSWFDGLFAALGLSESTGVYVMFSLYVTSLVFLLVGFKTRAACIATFALQLILSNSSPATVYGVDSFARVSLFYALWMPLGAVYSIDAILQRGGAVNSSAARIGLRFLQLHMALMYLASGIGKGMGAQWWNGEAIWRAVTMPELAQYDMLWLANYPWLPIFLGWATVILEVVYIAAVCSRRTRLPIVLAVISMHVGIALFLGLVSFASLMIVLNVSAFLIPSEPTGLKQTAASFDPQSMVAVAA
ncbi:HTTM domain-containing protein [Symmachiella dynata]|uniref:HTTM domain-containing protein n=1 Tax=Symmachiella dynata TaxID=2527995 RepID=UPI0030EE2D0A